MATETQAPGISASMNFATVTITRSVTIDCAGMTVTSFGELFINGVGIVVKVRNLTLNGAGAVPYGIRAVSMAALSVENCQIFGQTGNTPGIGISFAPGSGVTAQLYVADSVISSNRLASSGGGIFIQPAGTGSFV